MFTGLVEKTAAVKTVSKSSAGLLLTITASFEDLKLGDSVAINGACQTVVGIGEEGRGSSGSRGGITFEAMLETLKLTNLGDLCAGDIVNLERAMPALGRFNGHFVSGHIDGMAELLSVRKEGISSIYRFLTKESEAKYIVKKGSITINGVSLTVSRVADTWFEVNLIPHTLNHTNLGGLKVGGKVNIEVDMLAKYVEKFLCAADNNGDKPITEDFLRECGF